ncbi:MAG: hypothetical protein GYB31_05385 [Bacteroidetes bacterium]|nr:hypothetical protein [Bacteroidota bacterium]
MKHAWRKQEKQFYLPKTKPEVISIPPFRFFTIKGAGNPNDAAFAEYIGVLYALSYTIRMSPKKDMAPPGYFEYTVYPLEGVWDITDEAKKTFDGTLNKDDLVFHLMIRQPDFVDTGYAQGIIDYCKAHKPHPLLEQVRFETIEEGDCVQMMHLGPFDNEPETFAQMEAFAERQNLKRVSKIHREIYLSDPRKTVPEKLKTCLRFNVQKN